MRNPILFRLPALVWRKAALLLMLPGLLGAGLWLNHHPTARPDQIATPGGGNYGKLPLSFEANHGQAAASADFLARGAGYRIALNANEARLLLTKPANAKARANPSATIRQPQSITLQLRNANASASASGLDELPGKVNYLRGSDPTRWQTQVPSFARVRYAQVYPGVDVVYYGQQRQLEYDFIVAPHADPRAIRLHFNGAERLEIDAAGDLILYCADQQIRQHKPVVYQLADGARQAVTGAYTLTEDGEVAFHLGAYDAARALVIDPVLSYSTYWGSTGRGVTEDLDFGDFGADIAVDGAGNAYVTGYTYGNDFPTEQPLQPRPGGGLCGDFACPDMFVLKLNAAGTAVLYSTYLGGNGDDQATGIAVDAAGNAYITGASDSNDFPAGRKANNSVDAVIAKLNPDGSRLLYAYALGGSGEDSGNGIAIDAAGNAYITGTTFNFDDPNDFPVAQPYQRAPGGGRCGAGGETLPCSDAFVARLNANGRTLDYSSYLGGNSFEAGSAIALNGAGHIIVTGFTAADNFPRTPNAFQPNIERGVCADEPDFCFDSFLTKFSADGQALLYSTYLGGNGPDFAQGLAVDAAGNMLVGGTTLSSDFPLKNAQKTDNPLFTAFATKFDSNGALVYSTYLGGRFVENFLQFALAPLSIFGTPAGGNLLAVDAAGNAYVTGMTLSPDFPAFNAVQSQPGGGLCQIEGQQIPCPDAFVTKLNPNGALVYSTFLGGRSEEGGGLLQPLVESGYGIAADAAGNAYIVGITSSKNFPTVNPRQAALRGGGDLFITKLAEGNAPNALASVNAASYQGPQLAAESIVAAFGANLAPRAENATTTPLPTTLAGINVRVRDANNIERNAPLFFVSANQINYLMPLGTANGTAVVTVSNANGALASGEVRIVTAAPGLFTADGSGQGLVAGIVLRVRTNGAQVYEPAVEFDAATNRFVARPIDLGPAGERVFLVAFGTGFRFSTNTTASLGGVIANLAGVGAVGGLAGLDQANIEIPRSLAGRGEVMLLLTANGQTSNTVRVVIR